MPGMHALGLAAILAGGAAPWAAADRGQDIWVFRSVLDDRARVVTAGLRPDLWVAYDATNCGLWQSWNGGVKFDGAVYTTSHGPQPTSQGVRYYMGEPEASVWSLNGRPVKPAFRGYTWNADKVELAYEFDLGGGKKGMVYERPEAGGEVPGQTIELVRDFRTTGFAGEGPALRLINAPGSTVRGQGLTGGERAPGASPTLNLPASGSVRITHTFRWAPQPKSEGGDLLAAIKAEPQNMPIQLREDREQGLAMRVYWFNKTVERLPVLVDGQTANVNKVIPQIYLNSKEQFGFEDNFLVVVTGYLNVTEPGEYWFKVNTDDGHRFSIRDEVITENIGMATGGPIEGKFTLSPGEHPIRFEYFEATGGQLMLLEWRPPGQPAYGLVPETNWSTLKGEVRVVAPGEKQIMDPYDLLRPGDRRPLTEVHPSYDMATIRPESFRPRVGGIDFLPDGRMVICNWEPEGGVYIVDGHQRGQGDEVKVKRIAAGLAEPLGIKVVDGKIYVLQKQELTRLDDLDGDEIIDRYYAVANGWGVTSNFHEFAFGLVYKDGHFYCNLATAIDPGGRSTDPQNRDRGKTVKIGMDGSYSFVAHGLRTPNGIGEGPDGEIFVTDNQGDWLPVSKLVHLKPGAFYGNRSVNPRVTKWLQEQPPVVWLPQGEIGNSPGEPLMMQDGPYKSQMLHTEITHGGLKRTFIEKVNGEFQGAVFRFTQGLEAGINRAKFGPDGALYVGGIGSTGNWGQEGKQRYGLQRMRWNGKSTFEMLAVRAQDNGFEVEFTQPLGERGRTGEDWTVRSWTYVPTAEYGGPKVDVETHSAQVTGVSADGRRARIEIENYRPGRVYYLLAVPEVVNSKGEPLWSTEAWYTLNQIPGQSVNQLSPVEQAEGFEMLFDGSSLMKWTGYRRGDAPKGWQAVNGNLVFTPGLDNGYLRTKEEFGDFDLRLEFRLPKQGNSGIIYRADESQPAAWQTSYEYQLLDDPAYVASGDSHWTAANYDMQARVGGKLNPPGEWNEARIVAKGNLVQHWLNGEKVVEFTIGSPEWEAQFKDSKFTQYPGWGKRPKGFIVLQDHGAQVSFRSVRIRRL